MATATLIFLVFIGSMVMNVFGTAIYINEEIKPVLEELEIPEDMTLQELLKDKK